MRHFLLKLKPIFCLFSVIFFMQTANAANLYWVGGSGNWSDISHWSLSSGNSGNNISPSVPQSGDNVFFDTNSGFTAVSKNVSIDQLSVCNNITVANAATAPTFSGFNLSINGSLTAQSATSFNSSLSFLGSGANTVNAEAGVLFNSSITFNGTGSWTLSGTIKSGSIVVIKATLNFGASIINTGDIIFGEGNLNFGSSTINANRFGDPSVFGGSGIPVVEPRTLNLGSSISSFSGSIGTVWGYTGTNLIGGTSQINLTGSLGLSGLGFIGKVGHNYNNLAFTSTSDGGSSYSVSGGNFNVVTFNNSGDFNGGTVGVFNLAKSKNYSLKATVGVINNPTSACEPLWSLTGQIVSSNPISLNYARLTNATAIGAGPFTVNGGVDAGGNSGWVFNTMSKNLYWIGGGGAWDDPLHWTTNADGTPITGGCLPNRYDDVFFNSFSGSITLASPVVVNNSIAECRNITWAGVPGAPVFKTANVAATLSIFGSSTWQTGMLYQLANTRYSALTNGNTLTSNGVTIEGKTNFVSAGGWSLTDAFSSPDGEFNFDIGNLNTNGQTVTVKTFSNLDGLGLRALTLGSSTINVKESWRYARQNGATLTLNSGTSQINLTGSGASFFTQNGFTYYNVAFTNPVGTGRMELIFGGILLTSFNNLSFLSDGVFYGKLGINTLTLSPSKQYVVSTYANTSLTITNLTANTPDCATLLKLKSDVAGTQASINLLNPVNVTNAQINDINVIGSTLTVIGGIDGGNNTNVNITPTPPRNFYWIGGTGNWSDKTKWSLNSDGTANPIGGCLPTAVDNVFFNQYSGTSYTLTINVEAKINNMTWEEVAGSVPTIKGLYANPLNIGGSLVLQTGMIYDVQNTSFVSKLANNTIKTNGVLMGFTSINNNSNFGVYFAGIGSWSLIDAFNVKRILLQQGTLNTNNQILNIDYLISEEYLSTATLNLTSSVVNVFGKWSFYGNLNAGTSTINMRGTVIQVGGNPDLFYGGGVVYHDVNFMTTASLSASGSTFNNVTFLRGSTIYGTNQFNILTLSPDYSSTFQAGKTQTVNQLIKNSPCSIIDLGTFGGSNNATINSSSNINLTNIKLSGITAIGGATYNATGIDGGNNVGWTITNPLSKNLYWIGGNGNWFDSTHWTTNADGTPSGGCVPNQLDNVFFNQFSGNNLQVFSNSLPSLPEFRNMTWSGAIGNPTVNTALKSYGSLVLQANLRLLAPITFLSGETGNTISPNGAKFEKVEFQSEKDYTFLGDVEASLVSLGKGSLNTNNKNFRFYQFTGGGSSSLTLGASNLYGSSYTFVGSSLSSGSSKIYLSGNFTAKDGQLYNTINIDPPVNSTVNINAGFITNELILNPKNSTYIFEAGKTVQVNNLLGMSGTNCETNKIQSSVSGTQANLCVNNSASTRFNFLELKDINASCLPFMILPNSTNVGNNSNMVFAPTSGVGIGLLGPDVTILQSQTPYQLNAYDFAPNANTTFQWYKLNPEVALGTAVTQDVTTSGTYKVTVNYGTTCTLSDDITITVLQKAQIADIVAPDVVVCPGATTAILAATITSTSIIVNPVFTWYADQAKTTLLGSGPNITVNVASDTDFWVTVKGDNVSESDSKKVSVIFKAPDQPILAIINPDCSSALGSITITAVAGETYSVDGSAYTTTLTYAGLAPGTHTALAKSAGGCISPVTNFTINPAKVAAIQPVVAQTDPACGVPTGSITITAVPGETYSFDGSAYIATLSYAGLAPGTYTITSKSSDGCISIATTVTIGSVKIEAVQPVVSQTDPVCGVPTGSITITAVTGETYSVDGSAYTTTLTYAGLAPGAHTVTSKSSDGCISIATTVTIGSVKIAGVQPVVAQTDPVCGVPTGSITITAVTGETYSVDGSAYTTTLTYAGLAPGAHTVTSKSSDGCISAVTNVTINASKTEGVKPVVAQIDPVCGVPTGSITITAVTGETYSVDGSAYTTTLTYAGLAPGAHNVTSKSSDGCTSLATTVTIGSVKIAGVKPVVAQTDPVCGVPTGSITITAVTGETYSVDGSAYTTTLTYAGLAPGAHTVTSKSSDGCISAVTNVTINASKTEGVKPVVAQIDPTCGVPTGSITITAVTGETYSVDGSAYTTTLTYAGLAPGAYTVTSKSSDGCISIATTVTIGSVKIAGVQPVVAQTDPVCGVPTGSIIITAVTGETYSVDGSAYTTTLTYAGLAPGAHTITSKSSDGCISAVTNVTINASKTEGVKPVVAQIDPTCGVPTGSITITAVIGETYSVDGSAYTTTLTYAGLAPGAHNVTSKSSDGCTSLATTVTIGSVKIAGVQPVVAQTDPVCGVPTGSITITAVTGETYSVDGSAYTTTLTYAGLAPGAHTITSKSSDGCTSLATTVTIGSVKIAGVQPVVAQTDPVCGVPTGSITITAVTGETYSVDGSAYTTTLTYAGLASGAHTITSKSSDGCISTATTVTIGSVKIAGVKPVVAQTDPVCGVPTGSITITAVTGETYSVDGSAYTTTLTYAGLAPGAHTITSKSSDGCTSTATTVTIGSVKIAGVKPVVAQTDPVCDVPTGSITITAVTGETYSVDGSAYTTTLTYAGLAPGTHTITSKSSDGCTSLATTVTIGSVKIAGVQPVVAQTDPVCGVPTGSITITAVTGETYSVDGSAYTTTLTYAGLAPGAHTVTSKSSDGCISTATTVTIGSVKIAGVQPVAAQTDPVCGVPTGSITITAVIGETYSVDGSAYTTTLTYAGLAPGAHTITSKSSDGCISTATTVTIGLVKIAGVKPVVAQTDPVCGVPTGSITITAVIGETYSVDGSAYTTTLTYAGLAPGAHTITSKSSDGCTSLATTVTIGSVKVAGVKPVVMVNQPTCDRPTGSLNITAVVGETYSLDGGSYSSTLSYAGLMPGIHTVTAKSADGCISIFTNVTISPAKIPAIKAVVAITQPTCSVSTGSITITAVIGETYSIDGGPYTSNLIYTGLVSGNHTVVSKSSDGCNGIPTNIIINPVPAQPTATIAYPNSEYQAFGTANVIQTGQTGGTYTSTPGGLSINSTNGSINLSASTPNKTYVVTYSFANGGCTGSTTTVVKVNSSPATIAYGQGTYCAVGITSVVQTGPKGGTYSGNNSGLNINSTSGSINLGSSVAGNYLVTYTYQDGSVFATATFAITINALPISAITADITEGIFKGEVVTLTATGGATYSWSGPDIQSGQNTNVIKVRPRQTTDYIVTVTSASGCTSTSVWTVKVVEGIKLVPNNVITPNGDGKNDTWVVANLDYYPNNTVGIYDRAGRKVYGAVGYKNDWDGTYDGRLLAEGVYLYVIDLGPGFGLIRGTVSIIRDFR